MNYSSSFFWDFTVFYNIMDFCSPPHAGYWIIPQLSWPHRTLWLGGLVRFEGTMKFGLEKQEDKINEEEISIIHPLKEIPILLMQVAGMRPWHVHKLLHSSWLQRMSWRQRHVGTFSCVYIGQLSLVLWFIYIYIYSNLPTLTHGII